ncbi:hypothetical protein ACJIZ3_011487 [Penstemon smallii]|uniref:AT1G08220-like protein n=1 Tax=Penstemon smallii TaxID=265156 RepID=A0ABD3UJN8_9LAMI
MLRLKRVVSSTSRNVYASNFLLRKEEGNVFPIIPLLNPSQKTSTRFLDIYKMGSKKELEKERARIKDEMNRGYFADMSELKQHGGKISEANKVIIPAMVAVKFPTLEVNYSDGSILKLPITDEKDAKSAIPKASLLCLSFRASSQPMVDSWSLPFLDTFRDCSDVQLHEISFIDSWLLSRNPIKKLLLKIMRKPKAGEEKDVLKKQIVYSFGDHYYFRKELQILNLLTGYIFLIDKLGRIRWQGSGLATPDELSSLLSCTSLLLKE